MGFRGVAAADGDGGPPERASAVAIAGDGVATHGGPGRQARLPVVEDFGRNRGVVGDALCTGELDPPFARGVVSGFKLDALRGDVGRADGLRLGETGIEEGIQPCFGLAHEFSDGRAELRLSGSGDALRGEAGGDDRDCERIETVGVAHAIALLTAFEAEGAVADGADFAAARIILGHLVAVDLRVQFALQGGETEPVVSAFAAGIGDVALEVELLADDLGEEAVGLVVVKIQPRERLHDGAERLCPAALRGAHDVALIIAPAIPRLEGFVGDESGGGIDHVG